MTRNLYSPEFEIFWQAYPRKVAKRLAAQCYEKAIRRLQDSEDEPAEFLLERTLMFAESDAGKAGVYCPHPSTWLNQDRFMDDPVEWNRKPSAREQPKALPPRLVIPGNYNPNR